MTWIRSAFWTGQPHDAAEFRAAIVDELIPALKRLSGVEEAQALWPRRMEDDPPAIHCQILVHFASLAAVDRMLASPERAAMRGRVREIAATFDGTISHIDYDVS